jgi:hypothetical protein
MDYFPDACASFFTAGQADRMDRAVSEGRPSLGDPPVFAGAPSEVVERRIVAGASFGVPATAVVEAPAVLVMEPGTTLAFAQYQQLVVEGRLQATGARFTRASGAPYWRGLEFRQAGEAVQPVSTLDGCEVEYAGPPATEQVAVLGAVAAFDRGLALYDTEIRDSQDGVIGLLASGNAAEVTVTDGSLILRNDGGGALAASGADLTISGGSEVRDNPGGGVAAAGYGSLLTLDDVTVQRSNGGSGIVATPGVRALYNGVVQFADGSAADKVFVLDNDGGLDARNGGTLNAGMCDGQACTGAEHEIVGNALTGFFDARSKNGSTLFAEGNFWDVTQLSQLDLEKDGSSVLEVCPIVGGTCDGLGRLAGSTLRGPEEVLALVEAAERAHLAGDMEAFEIAADAIVATLGTSATEDERRAAFEAATRLFAWAQPGGPLASLASLAGQEGETQPWATRALGVAHASAEDYTAARAVADTLASAYAGSEHAQYGLGLAVRVTVAQEDEAGALAALDALVAAFPEAEEVGELAALVLGTFPEAQVEAALNRRSLPTAAASSSVGAGLTVGAAQPNPAAGRALIPFELAEEAMVEAVLYDGLGRRVAVLASGAFGAGRHTVVVDDDALPAGVYVVHVTAQMGTGRSAFAVRPVTLAR